MRLLIKVCFKCRQPGHRLADCTAEIGASKEKICFKCGSIEHSLYQCPKYDQSHHDGK